jgi:hypothetical protein
MSLLISSEVVVLKLLHSGRQTDATYAYRTKIINSLFGKFL